MKRELILFPCGGNTAEALDCLGDAFKAVAFVDDGKIGLTAFGLPVLGREAFAKFPNALVLAAPGSPTSFKTRAKLIESLGIPDARFARVIHPEAQIGPHAKVGKNALIMAGVVITSNAVIGDHVCILPNSVIHHDCEIGNYSMIGTNVTVAGRVRIGRNTYVGSGSSIINGITIGDGALIGMGSNVIRDVAAGSVVAGNPARPLKK